MPECFPFGLRSVDSEYKHTFSMEELLKTIARALVDNPDEVQVRGIEGERVTVLELRVAPTDVGKIIGRLEILCSKNPSSQPPATD